MGVMEEAGEEGGFMGIGRGGFWLREEIEKGTFRGFGG